MRADVFDVAKRSAIMRAVKSRDTSPELAVRAAVRALGFGRRYRLDGAQLPGKPDLVFGALGKVVFVHGCFWHGHDCKHGAVRSKTRTAFWDHKIAGNRDRDARKAHALKKLGWHVETVWECQCSQPALLNRLRSRIMRRARATGT